jgi:hypothetical protein
MKQLAIIFITAFLALSGAAQFAGLSSNQLVTFHNLKNAVDNGILVQRFTVPDNNRVVTKSEAIYYVVLDESNVYLSAKSSNQLVAKRDLTPGNSLTDIYIQANASVGPAGTASVIFTAYDGAFTETNVDVAVEIHYRLTDDLGTIYFPESVIIPSGYYTGYNYSPVSYWAYGVSIEILWVNPATSSTQRYNVY